MHLYKKTHNFSPLIIISIALSIYTEHFERVIVIRSFHLINGKCLLKARIKWQHICWRSKVCKQALFSVTDWRLEVTEKRRVFLSSSQMKFQLVKEKRGKKLTWKAACPHKSVVGSKSVTLKIYGLFFSLNSCYR